MYLSKLVNVLKAFDKAQMVRLKKYIHSPYFAVYPPSILLFNYLHALYPLFPEKKITVQRISKCSAKLSSAKQQDDAHRWLMRAIEKFIAQEVWHKNDMDVSLCMLKGFKELGLPDKFEKSYTKAMKQLEEQPVQDFDTFFSRHVLTELSFNGPEARLQRTTQNNLMPVLKTLDEFHALKKLRYLCEIMNRHRVLGTAVPNEDTKALLKILKPYAIKKYPYVYLFVNLYHMLEETTYADSDVYYRLLKQFIEQAGPELSDVTREVADYALNNCLRWNNKGYEEAGHEYLGWIEWKRKRDLLFQQGKLMPVTFRNMIAAAQSQKNAVLIQHITKTYGPYLPGAHREPNTLFAEGIYYYTVANFKEAVRCFLQAQATDGAVFNGILRRWHWMSLYALDRSDTDALFNNLHAFEKYLQRHSDELQHRSDAFRPFIEYATLLVKSANDNNLKTHQKDLQDTAHFAGKEWLLLQFAAQNKKPVRQAHG